MPVDRGEAVYSKVKGREWIEKILPSAWEELCTKYRILAGVVVLKSWNDESFYENASFGFDDDGFFYSFLARGEEGWERIKSASAPIQFSSDEYPIFTSNSVATVMGIRSSIDESFIGFVLAEADLNRVEIESFLYLLSEKISNEMSQNENSVEAKQTEMRNIPPSQTPLVVSLLPAISQKILKMREEKILTIFGPRGSGKKTLAKWIHQETRPNATCLFLANVPDHLGKLEKALSVWTEETKDGTLVFLDHKKWSLGQQKIVMDWMASGLSQSQVLFLNDEVDQADFLTGFAKLLRRNYVQIPPFSYIEKQDLKTIIVSLFKDLSLSQNRSGLELDPSAIEVLLDRGFPSNFTDLKNALLSAILKGKGTLVTSNELESGHSNLNLDVPDAEDLDLRRGIQALERQKILNAMRIFSGNQLRMAKALGISRGALQNKMKQLGL